MTSSGTHDAPGLMGRHDRHPNGVNWQIRGLIGYKSASDRRRNRRLRGRARAE